MSSQPQDTPYVDETFDEKKPKKRSFNPAKVVVGGITQGSKAVVGGVAQGTQAVRGGISQGKFHSDLSQLDEQDSRQHVITNKQQTNKNKANLFVPCVHLLHL